MGILVAIKIQITGKYLNFTRELLVLFIKLPDGTGKNWAVVRQNNCSWAHRKQTYRQQCVPAAFPKESLTESSSDQRWGKMEEGISNQLKYCKFLFQHKCSWSCCAHQLSCNSGSYVFQYLLLQAKLQHLKSMNFNFKRIIQYFSVNL